MMRRMLSTLKKTPLGNNRGSMIIMAAVALVAMFAFAALTIDGAELMTTRNQLQAAADAAALAGASGLIAGNQATATARAIAIAGSNMAEQDIKRPVIIDAGDVTFPNPGQVRVRTHRTQGTGDALVAYFLKIVNPASGNLTDVTATATAEYYDVCASECLKPWAIPDRWGDTNGNGQMDPGEPYDPVTTGYQAPNDVGVSVVLKMGNPQQTMAPGQYYPIDLPPLNCPCGIQPQTGGAEYSWNIANCSPYTVGVGDQLQLEPGNKVGPTAHGVQDLIDQDPGAYWNSSENTVQGSAFGKSPRVILVPFFDPNISPQSGRNYVQVSKIGAFFIEDVQGNGNVTGRFINATVDGEKCAVQNPGTFLKGLALVQ